LFNLEDKVCWCPRLSALRQSEDISAASNSSVNTPSESRLS